jgi:hypothetical protein
MLSHRAARPITVPQALHLRARKGRATPVDFCNQIDLRARPTNRPNPAHRPGSRLPGQLFSRVATLVPGRKASLRSPFAGARPVGSSWVRGIEARVRIAPHCLVHLRLRSLAKGALPQPYPPGHLVSQTRGAAGWSLPLRPGTHVGAPTFSSLPDAHCCLDNAHRLGPPHTPLREERRIPLHPRCLPSPDAPRPGLCPPFLHNLSPACGV